MLNVIIWIICFLNGFTLVIENIYLRDGIKETIIEEFKQCLNPDRIYTHENIALVAVVGCGMVKNIGVSARVFKAIADAGINVNMIDQGSSELNIIIGVENDEKGKCIRALYNEFFN